MKLKKYTFKNNYQQFIKSILIIGMLFFSIGNQIFAQCTQLVWSDEFNNATIDGTKWNQISGGGGFGNAELQTYSPSNSSIATVGTDSCLKIEARYSGGNYTSSKLETAGKYSVKYGRIEARMKLSSGGGAWPAFWMLADGNNWPYTGEIDIMEAKHKNPKYVEGTIHHDGGGYDDYHGAATPGTTTDLSADFHIYAVEWGPNVIKWYIDNTLYYTATPKVTSNGDWPFNDRNFYIILNLAVGGPGTPFTGSIAPTPADYPTSLFVDYVRVYSGAYNYAIAGSSKAYENQTNQFYSIANIPGVTYNWSVPAGATITAGQSTNQIKVNWGTTSGDVSLTTSIAGCTSNVYKFPVILEKSIPIEQNFEDFESNRLLYPAKDGALTEGFGNPSFSGVNTSSLVGKYVRNSTKPYDVIVVKNLTITNANDFIFGRKRFSIDVYSTAPIGSKINLQLENSTQTTSTNFPTGRQSKFVGITTTQNQWETITFDFESIIDANTSIFAIDTVTLLFEPGINSGNTFYFDNVLVRAKPTPPIVATDVLEDYDGIRLITKGTSTGTYTPDLANPGSNLVNGSAKAAKYIRNLGSQYDVLFFNTNTNIKDAGTFKDQTNVIQIDVYTAAPIGTAVTLNFENSSTSLSGNYPTGRNSTYQAITTKQNQWETLTFSFVKTPDAGTSNLLVDQMVFLFDSGNYTGSTYYIDNIRIGKTKPTDTYTTGDIYEDYETIHNISYNTSDGLYSPTFSNPNGSGINTSASVGKYTRVSTKQYDNISFVSPAIPGVDFKNGTKKFAMDLYTSAPVGTIVTWQLESSARSTPSNYPTGRHSIYQAVVGKTNEWHTLVFSYQSTPDAATTDGQVDRFVYLFKPGTATNDTYYFDNLRSLNTTLGNETFDSTDYSNKISVYPNPASDFVNVNSISSELTKQITITDISGRIIYQKNVDNSNNENSIDISGLNKGVYLITLKTTSSSFTKKIIKQ